MSIEQILKEHFRYGNREPELCGCGQWKEWAGGPPDEWESHVAGVIREAIAQEIEPAANRAKEIGSHAYGDGLNDAVSIIRGSSI